jgi:HAD superfamily hydrolase (TIGR01549 family)
LRLPEASSVYVLLLDAGGVLIKPSFARVREALASRGVAASAERLAAAEPPAKRELDRDPAAGAGTDAERGWQYFNLVLAHAGIPRSPATDAALDELRRGHARSNLWEDVPDGVRTSLARFRARGLRMAVVSNANGTVGALLDRLELSPFFDAVLDSAVEGVEKPDPRLFLLALERLGALPGEAVHVGDFYSVDVVGARAAGIRPILLDEAGLYPDADCPRVRSLADLAGHLDPPTVPADISAKLPPAR